MDKPRTRDELGRYAVESRELRKVRSLRVTDEVWASLEELAVQNGYKNRADYLEAWVLKEQSHSSTRA